MGRKRIHDLLAYKFSLDLTGKNKNALDSLSDNKNLKYGPIINLLISSFCCMPDDMRQIFTSICIDQYKYISAQAKYAGEYEKVNLLQKCDHYKEIASIINDGKPIEIIIDPNKIEMRKIIIKNGYITIPTDWILLNPDEAKNCTYAAVVECRYSEKYGIPHFLHFNNKKYGKDFDPEYEDFVSNLCVKAWPKFQDIIDRQVTLVADPADPSQYLNGDEYSSCPKIGVFHVYEKGDPLYGDNYEPPYGAMIVRDTTKNA